MTNLNKEDKYWQELKSENYNDTFPKVERWMNNLNSEKTYNFKPNRIQIMKNFFSFNKFKLVYSILLLAIIFAACTVPVTQNETVARGLNWKIAKSSAEGIEKINLLPWIDKSKLTVQEFNDADKSILTYNFIVTAGSEEEFRNYMKQLEDIPGVITVNLYALNETKERPLYAAALHSMFRIDIDATNMSDEQATQELQKQLKDAGIENVNISYKRNSSGDRMLEMSPLENSTGNNNFELRIKDGNNHQFVKTRQKSDVTFELEGKSDDEIKRIIVEDMKKDGTEIKPEDVKIERDEKGRVKIELTKKDDSKGRVMENKIELKIK